MRILILNQTFWPDVAATAQHAHDLAAHLVRRGHTVTALASRSRYGSRGATLPRAEEIDGVRVIRVGRSLFGKAGILARAADFALFYLAATLKLLRVPRQDVVICLTTPPLIVLAGLIARMLRGGRVVYWMMDVYPDAAIACGVLSARNPIAALARAIDGLCLRWADATVVLGRCMRDRVLRRGADASRIHVIGVWSDDDEVAGDHLRGNGYRNSWNAGDRIVVMYSGNFGLGHDVSTMLLAAERLREDQSLLFAFVGEGKRRAEIDRFVRERNLTNCVLEPLQPRERLAELLAAGDIHLVTLRPEATGTMVPSKYYGILAAGRPAVFVGAPESEVGLSISEEGTGATVAPGDVEGLISVLKRIAGDAARRAEIGRTARETLASRHSRRVRCETWEALLVSLTPTGGRT